MKSPLNDIIPYLENMDKYLNLQVETEVQTAIAHAFSRKDGSYEGMPYESKEFRDLVIGIFDKEIGESMENVRVGINISNFPALVKKRDGLIKRLNGISLSSTLHISVQANNISQERWSDGERGTLFDEYTCLKSEYLLFRNSLRNIVKSQKKRVS